MAFTELDFEIFSDLAIKYGLTAAVEKLRSDNLYGDEKLRELQAEYGRLTSHAQDGYPPKIVAAHGHESWYPGPQKQDIHWPALRDHLEASGRIPNDQLVRLDEASSKIISYTPRPAGGAWAARGLVLGHVQSGKTTNFTAVIAKAVDVGYNLVIVLSGIHNGLRAQTQSRLEAQLRDLNSDKWVTLTDDERDFHAPPHALESVLSSAGDRKAVLIVAKKNAAVLNKLAGWVEDSGKGGLRNVKALIIDDESDQATVATPKINPLIVRLLNALPRHTLIGYTATPFANVLSEPSKLEGLYPKDFILNLPRPHRYFGTEMIFGRDDAEDGTGPVDGYKMVRLVPDEEAAALRPPRKPRRKKGENPPPNPPAFEPDVTRSLRKATLWFWLATAARRTRGPEDHSTMLVHTSMKTEVHQAFRKPLEELRDEIRGGLARSDPAIEEELARLWSEETAAVPAERFEGWGLTTPTYEAVRGHLEPVVSGTRVVLDNSRSEDRLDYRNGPVTAIAVGGNTLSRGLTLEGLVVSFFIRSAKAYDTLLQMGRWFGFRVGYEDLPRIFMTKELKSWFRHLAMVEHEIRLDIERYEEQSLTPLDFGPRIRTHPTLLATQKLGASRQDYASYGGRRVQARYFRHRDVDWLEKNLHAAQGLVADAASASGEPERRSDGSALWRDVPVHAVLSFLSAYRSHPDSPDLNRDLLVRYIEDQIEKRSLERWSVAVMGAADTRNGTADLAGYEFGRIVRSRLDDKDGDQNADRADIKTLMSKEHRVADLDITPAAARRKSEAELVALRNADGIHRSRGLVLLYPIDPTSAPDDDKADSRSPLDAVADVIGMALVFPGNEGAGYISVDLSKLGAAAVEALEDEDTDEVDALVSGVLDDEV